MRERKLVSQMSKDDHNKSNVAKWLKSTDISKYLTVANTLAYCAGEKFYETVLRFLRFQSIFFFIFILAGNGNETVLLNRK